MRAVVVEAPRRARVVVCPRPAPGAGEVLVRVEGSGVCASNVPAWEGRSWFEYPRAPGEGGHEAWGTVLELGRGVREPREGTRVAFLSDRAYAELALARAEETVPLPEALAREPVPAEALGCAINAFERSEIRPGDRVAIVGTGFLGSLLCRLASNSGALVIAIARRRSALDAARAQGASETVLATSASEVLARVAALAPGGCERVIEATGAQEPLDLAARLCAVRARLVIVGYHQEGKREVDLQLWNWRGLDVVNAHEREPARYLAGMRRAIDELVAGRLDPRPLYTHRFGFEHLGDALEAAAMRPAGFCKALWIADGDGAAEGA